MIGHGAGGGRRRQEVVQVAADDGAQLLLQVDALRLGHAGGHRQTLVGQSEDGVGRTIKRRDGGGIEIQSSFFKKDVV